MSNLTAIHYNPDVLSCLANLSNDEVFTPPDVANQMLDILPRGLWQDKHARFLDPVTKSGVFLREIAKRLIVGLEDTIPDLQERLNHIFTKQLYGVAITELTSLLSRRTLYCSKWAHGKYSICTAFDNPEGHIVFERIEHTWENGKCLFCGAAQAVYDRTEDLETHAYRFLHTNHPEEIFHVKFDVIVGNPPYQLSDGGYGVSASPIYDKFVLQAKKLTPRYLTMIIPARWFSGGKGLDDFRHEMLHDNRMRAIHDYPEASDCFPGVQIKGGVCYFLWDRDNPGDCTVVTHRGDKVGDPAMRPLLEQGTDTFIRYNEAIDILKKVRNAQEESMEAYVSSPRPFGLRTFFHGRKTVQPNDVLLYENGGTSFIERNAITRNTTLIDQYKVFIPESGSGSDSFPHPILGKPFIGEPNTACTETYLVIGPYASENECQNVVSYISTRFFRFLVMLKKPTQHATSKVYSFAPVQDFSQPWTDAKLYAKYGIIPQEIAFIESMVRPMETGAGPNG